MTSVEFYILPSFCNAWPLISVEVNGQELWINHVDHPQTVCVEFKVEDTNTVRIKYLNKRLGPDYWDTIVDETGKILQDQNCVISDIKIGGSRCDFLLLELAYHNQHCGLLEPGLYGFMSHQGYYEFKFPRELYTWIIDQRRSRMISSQKRSSSLDYWTNYLGDNSNQDTFLLIEEIEVLLSQL